jgi:hypothetical protein
VTLGWASVGAGGAAAPTASTIKGLGPQSVQYVREVEGTFTQSTEFVDIPEATATVVVPPGRRAVVLIRLTGVVTCNGGADLCLVQATVDGIPAEPAGPIGITLANPDDPGPDTRSFESSAGLSAGTHVISVQWRVTSEIAQFTIANWHMTVEVTPSPTG